MKIAEINYGIHGSTGNMMLEIADSLRGQGHEAHTFSAWKMQNTPEGHAHIGSLPEQCINRGLSISTGISDIWSVYSTRKLICHLDEIKPDVIHLHNLHGWYLCLPLLFSYFKKKQIPIVWTLHDCWSFTAQCSHFTVERCEKWKTGCYGCPRYKLYPNTLVDQTWLMWKLKREWLQEIPNLTLVTPSCWLASLVKQSYLNKYPVQVVPNGIDLTVFTPVAKNNFRTRMRIADEKFVLLGVASNWNQRKGLDVFVELCSRMDQDKYQIVLVGVDRTVKQQLPSGIIAIEKTQNRQELVEIYSSADLFVNPTREDNFPTVNIEALACGTPVLTFRTGGSPEAIDSTCGAVVEQDDISGLMREIVRIQTEHPYSVEACVEKASLYSKESCYQAYVRIYNELCKYSN